MSDRPNVLWICTDQQFAGAMSCAGNEWLETPGMDRIAEGGTQFTDAYCPYPLCVPSRASMLTGRMPSGIREAGGYGEAYRDEELGNLFAEAGYTCAYAGKWHVPSMRHVDPGHGFEELCGIDDHRVPEVCTDFLAEEHEEPFLLAAHFDNPHNICEWARDYTPPWGEIEDAPPSACPPLPSNFAVPPYEPRIIRQQIDGHWAMGAMADATPDEWRQYRHAYYRMIELADHGIGRILDALETHGHAEDTLIVFTSDHGDAHGAHQLVQKTFPYEEQARVPFLVRPPGGSDVAESDALVSTGLDLVPTLCAYADIETPPELRGRSVRPLVAGETVDWRPYLVVETGGDPGDRFQGRMIRTDQYKYVVYHEQRHNEQLFDMTADRDELVDLSTSDRYAEVLDAHREYLLEWCLETGDRFGARYHHPDVPMIPGYDFEELWPLVHDEPPGMI